MILSSEWDDIEVVLERERVRALAATLFPDRMELYDMVYESRFDRLWEQFRSVVARGEGEEDDLDAA
jgi:hypothetical protein